MYAEFVVNTCFTLSGLGIVASGEVTEGEVSDTSQGRTAKGKNFTLIKIDVQGAQVRTIRKKDKANLFIKNIDISDIKPGVTVYFY